LQPLLRAVVERYKYIVAAEERQRFKHLLRSYINLYAFLSQVITFRDPELERLYLFARLLLRALPPEQDRTSLTIHDKVDLESFRIQKAYSGRIQLQGNGEPLLPITGLDESGLTVAEQAVLSQIIREINERFGTDFTEADRVFFAELKARLAANEALRASARVNPPESVRLLHDVIFDAVLQTMIEKNFELFKRINDDPSFAQAVRELIFRMVYRELRKEVS